MNKHQFNFAIKNNLSFEHKLKDIIIEELIYNKEYKSL